MKKKNKIFYILIIALFLFLPLNVDAKIILVAGHGEGGSQVTSARAEIDGKVYHEAVYTRRSVEIIAEELARLGIDYEIANTKLNDYYWSMNEKECNSCGTAGTCCGYKNILTTAPAVNQIIKDNYNSSTKNDIDFVLEIHLNAGGGDYTLAYLHKGAVSRLETNAQKFVDAIGGHLNISAYTREGYFTESNGNQRPLTTLTYFESQGIDAYLIELVFMDNKTQFKDYLDNEKSINKKIAQAAAKLVSGNNDTDSDDTDDTDSSELVDPKEIELPNLEMEEKVTCESVFYDDNGDFNEFGQLLQDVFTFIKVAAPILLIALSSLDYIKAITSKDADELKKANERFIKRLVAAVVLFLLPFILDLTFELFGVYDMQTCGIR